MKYEVYEQINFSEDFIIIANNLTETEARKLVSENPRIRVMMPSIVNNS